LHAVDLKTARSIRGEAYCKERKVYLRFFDYWDYWIQMGCYLEALRIKYGIRFDGYIAAMEKTPPYDHDVFEMDKGGLQQGLWKALAAMDEMGLLLDVPSEDLPGCNSCDYCIANRYLKETTLIKPDPRAFNY